MRRRIIGWIAVTFIALLCWIGLWYVLFAGH